MESQINIDFMSCSEFEICTVVYEKLQTWEIFKAASKTQ